MTQLQTLGWRVQRLRRDGKWARVHDLLPTYGGAVQLARQLREREDWVERLRIVRVFGKPVRFADSELVYSLLNYLPAYQEQFGFGPNVSVHVDRSTPLSESQTFHVHVTRPAYVHQIEAIIQIAGATDAKPEE